MPSLTIWTRLEPRCRAADMTIGLEARTHDPFWMLARQWQLGELAGSDAGSPIVAAVESVDMPLDRYAGPDAIAKQVPPSTPLEAWVERETVRPRAGGIDYRQSAESGLQFLRMLRLAKMDGYVPAYVSRYAIPLPAVAERARLDLAARRLVGAVGNRVPDGARIATELRAALPALPAAPAIPSPDDLVVLGVAKEFLAWYDALFDEPAAPVPDSGSVGAASDAWVNERMEFSFALDASAADAPGSFAAKQYAGEPLDWTSFDGAATALGPVVAPAPAVRRELVPAPVGFKGMPARRYWEIEDASVDLGAIDAGPADLGRLMLREFALIYGNDWFVVPIPVRVGAVCRISSLAVTDTFGVSQTIPHYTQTADGGRWRMFAVSGDTAPHRLLVPPLLARSLTSEPIEQVLFIRDEPANIAWGIERIVQGASGAAVERASTPAQQAPAADAATPSLHYHLGTSVPESYIPFVPVAIDVGQRRMRRAAFLRADGTPGIITPLGRLLAPDVPMFEEEFAREGVRVERRYRLARWTDGSTHLWVARRKEVGATVGSSGLQYDSLTE